MFLAKIGVKASFTIAQLLGGLILEKGLNLEKIRYIETDPMLKVATAFALARHSCEQLAG